jgi:integrase
MITKINYLYPEEVPQVINWLEGHGATKKRTSSQITYQQVAAFCHVAYEHGLRVNEVVNLRWNHNLQEIAGGHRLVVQRQKGSDRTDQPMSAALYERLKRLQKTQAKYWLDRDKEMLSSWVFISVLDCSGHISPETPDVKLRQALRSLGWERKGTTSLFKHACAIQMAKSGRTQSFIQQWLGHVDFSSTEWYLKFAPGAINESPWE